MMPINGRCSSVPIGRTSKDMIAALEHHLWRTIMDSSNLVEVIPRACLAFTTFKLPPLIDLVPFLDEISHTDGE